MPTTHLKIPNNVAARRIARTVLKKYDLSKSLEGAIGLLIANGELEGTLGCYRELMTQRDVTEGDLINRSEADHRDSFYYCLMKNPYLVPRVEVPVIKVNPLLTIS